MTHHLERLTVAIASGKGGTGKTLLSTALALLEAESGTKVTLVDCDVEAPNDHLFLETAGEESTEVEVPLVEIDDERCTRCGICRDSCVYGALRILGGRVLVFAEMCHGCGRCVRACPADAIRERPVRVGEVVRARVIVTGGPLELVTGRLDIGEVKAPHVIRAARALAADGEAGLTILDCPPGVACSAVAAVRGADALVLVTEPTPFGLHDLALSVELGRSLGVPLGVVVNRHGAGDTDVDEWCHAERIPVLAHIPFDRRVAEAYAIGKRADRAVPGLAETFACIGRSMRSLAATRPRGAAALGGGAR